jgi:phenylalanyl-tRNA synthetase beta chain
MKFSYNLLQSFFEKKLPPAEELAEILMMHFFEVEEVEKIENDFMLDIDVLSNRAGDCFSHIGIAREIAAVTKMNFEIPKIKMREKGENIEDLVRVEVKGGCSRYMLKGVSDVKIEESPQHIQKVLKVCGINPINNVVDIVNYVMIETGQPLHAFDAEKLEGEKIFVRYAKKREKIVTLDEKRQELQESILVISDEVSSVGVAGIKGGIVAEVDKKTKKIYIEAANFDPVTIRRGSHNLKIRTDASLRFEHGMSPETAEFAINRAATMISQIAKGVVMRGVIDYYPEKQKAKNINFEIENVRKVLGENISLKETERILKALEFKVRRNKNSFFVTVPFFRIDVSIKEDIVEEIGRIYGYDKIEAQDPIENIIPAERDKRFLLTENIKNIWQGFGFYETYNYSFINGEVSKRFEKKKLIEVEKPVSLEFKYLRPSLIPGMLRNLVENEKNYEKIRLFEIGSVFYKEEETKEKKSLSLVSSGDDFYQMKGKITSFLSKVSTSRISYEKGEKKEFFDDRKTAKIFLEKEEVGFLGEISKDIKKEMKIKGDVFIAEFDLEKVIEKYTEVKKYEPICKFPPLVRDLSVLVPKDVIYKKVLEEIKKEGGAMLKEITLFDLYKGKGVPAEMKSFAFRLSFQSKNKTLSSGEVNVVFEKIINALEKNPEYKVRK